MVIDGKEVKHITIRTEENGDDIIYIGEKEIINGSKNLKVFLQDKNHELICKK